MSVARRAATATLEEMRARISPRWVALAAVASIVVGVASLIALRARPRAPLLPAISSVATVVRASPAVLVAIRDLARLESAEFHMERVVDFRERQSHLFGLLEAEDALLLVAAGEVVAGVDLAGLREGDVRVDGPKAVVTLPAPVVFSTRLDAQRTYVHSRRTDLLARRVEALEGRAREEAERTLQRGAEEAGILARARQNAARTVQVLVTSLGYDEVTVRFADEGLAPIAM